ncbi:MAG: cob(I)yrinic acid a,c-diamide adenosyltransferase [Betaproteobacteria bacterium]|nr:cob(I)yrinic acid a,c-diamide adenosyltransferase [Betaproteobacteria bacterium]
MGHRLSKIVTRTGDKGDTGLGDGSRTGKDSARIEAIGTVDELNSCLGLLLAEQLPQPIRDELQAVQNDLFDLGGELAVPGHAIMSDQQVKRIEAQVEGLNRELEPLKEFILPGGTRAAALAHVARTVCRRAERRIVAVARNEQVGIVARIYLNRLSDLMFVIGRTLNRAAGSGDVQWKPGKNR